MALRPCTTFSPLRIRSAETPPKVSKDITPGRELTREERKLARRRNGETAMLPAYVGERMTFTLPPAFKPSEDEMLHISRQPDQLHGSSSSTSGDNCANNLPVSTPKGASLRQSTSDASIPPKTRFRLSDQQLSEGWGAVDCRRPRTKRHSVISTTFSDNSLGAPTVRELTPCGESLKGKDKTSPGHKGPAVSVADERLLASKISVISDLSNRKSSPSTLRLVRPQKVDNNPRKHSDGMPFDAGSNAPSNTSSSSSHKRRKVSEPNKPPSSPPVQVKESDSRKIKDVIRQDLPLAAGAGDQSIIGATQLSPALPHVDELIRKTSILTSSEELPTKVWGPKTNTLPSMSRVHPPKKARKNVKCRPNAPNNRSPDLLKSSAHAIAQGSSNPDVTGRQSKDISKKMIYDVLQENIPFQPLSSPKADKSILGKTLGAPNEVYASPVTEKHSNSKKDTGQKDILSGNLTEAMQLKVLASKVFTPAPSAHQHHLASVNKVSSQASVSANQVTVECRPIDEREQLYIVADRFVSDSDTEQDESNEDNRKLLIKIKNQLNPPDIIWISIRKLIQDEIDRLSRQGEKDESREEITYLYEVHDRFKAYMLEYAQELIHYGLLKLKLQKLINTEKEVNASFLKKTLAGSSSNALDSVIPFTRSDQKQSTGVKLTKKDPKTKSKPKRNLAGQKHKV